MIYFPDLGSTPPTSTLTLLLTRSPLVGNSYRCTDSPPSWRFLMVALSCFLFRTVAATIAYFPFPLSSATTQAQTPIDNPKHNTHTLEDEHYGGGSGACGNGTPLATMITFFFSDCDFLGLKWFFALVNYM
ncbi:hypothetical protein GmHk_12G033766 [Glycine max]|nr:hypothetical protein GmHk_12G033766 [Glycine max]